MESFLNNSSSRNWSSKNSRSALPASSSSCQLDSAATIKRSLMGADVARLGRSAHLVSSSKTPLYDRPCFEASLPPSSSSPLMRLIFRGLAAHEENWRLAWRGACSTGRLVRCGRLCARAVQEQCKRSANISSASMCAKSTQVLACERTVQRQPASGEPESFVFLTARLPRAQCI